jgi:hypothetical protein
MKLNGTHHLLVYTHAINILGGSIYTIKKNTEAVAVCSNETGLEVKAEKMSMKDKITTQRQVINTLK